MFKVLGCVTGAVVLSTAAMAADLPYKAPPMLAPASAYNWTGFYLGAHVGFGSGRATVGDPAGPSAGITTKGFLGGGQLGYNQQVGAWVFGLEADISGADIDGTIVVVDPGTGDVSSSTARVRWTSLLTGRIGYAHGPWLPYIKGGAAFGGTRLSGVDITNGGSFSTNVNRTGWTVGAGLEYALGGPWTVRAQYDYVDFGPKTLTAVDTAGAAFPIRSKQNIHQAKFGVNYRFGR